MNDNKITKIILLAVTGSSPQVVTETLYGIYEKKLDWPTELHIITTQFGANKAQKALIDDKQLQKLLNDYDLPDIKFDSEAIHIIPDAKGDPVEDARNEADHAALADYITRIVAQFTLDDTCLIHASIAGGRKTMTFFLGYAMSMFSRPWDHLSHVLITEGYENCKDFYYPTPVSKTITDWNGKEYEANNAQVNLIDIPYLRQREQLGGLFIKQFSDEESGSLKYNDIITLNNMVHTPEKVTLKFDYSKCCIIVCGVEIPLKNSIFSFYAAILWANKNQDFEVYRPGDKEANKEMLRDVIDQLELLERNKISQSNTTDFNLQRLGGLFKINTKTADTLRKKKGISRVFFDGRLNYLKNELEKYLPKSLSDKFILPAPIVELDGTKVDADKKSINGSYGIRVLIKNITGIKGVKR